MQKICLLVFSSLIFLLSLVFFPPKIYAQTIGLSPSANSQQENQVNYELPYPGLLPDNPLYFLRVIRDKTIEFLISDPLKKAEFYLLQADKRLNAGIFLFNKGKIPLSISTISKAENYFSQALDKVGEVKSQKKSVSEIEGRMKDAAEKYEQELGILISKSGTNYKASYETELKRVQGFEVRLSR
jgi:hypothetical protein